MSLTYRQARDEILAIFKSAWDATGYTVHYEDVRIQRDADNEPYAVVLIRHASGFQATLTGATGSRIFTRVGTLIVQVYTPSGGGLQDSYSLAKVIADAYEGSSTPGGVWFRNVRLNEIGRDGEFFQSNMLVDFEYDEVK